MTKLLDGITNDPRRKVRFKEISREIVAKDRYNRRYGQAVDTAGGIAQALERAYKEGFHDGRHGPPPVPVQADDGPVEWVMIPPRARTAFWSICRFGLPREGWPDADGRVVPALTERGTAGWIVYVPGRDFRDESVIADRTINVLVRLDLLEAAPDNPSHRILSARGHQTWQEFLLRGGQYPEDLTSF